MKRSSELIFDSPIIFGSSMIFLYALKFWERSSELILDRPTIFGSSVVSMYALKFWGPVTRSSELIFDSPTIFGSSMISLHALLVMLPSYTISAQSIVWPWWSMKHTFSCSMILKWSVKYEAGLY